MVGRFPPRERCQLVSNHSYMKARWSQDRSQVLSPQVKPLSRPARLLPHTSWWTEGAQGGERQESPRLAAGSVHWAVDARTVVEGIATGSRGALLYRSCVAGEGYRGMFCIGSRNFAEKTEESALLRMQDLSSAKVRPAAVTAGVSMFSQCREPSREIRRGRTISLSVHAHVRGGIKS